MTPTISTSEKGKISIKGKAIDFDFHIDASGKILKRELSKEDPENQLLSLDEAGQLYDPNINELIIGSDMHDKIQLSNEATDFFEEKKCKIKLLPLREAITYWNRYEGHAIGLFHLAN
jgi:hypothetical protein